jgi:nicotinamidase-related amidase
MRFFLSIIVVFAFSFHSQASTDLNNSGLAVVLVDMQYGFYQRGQVEGTRGLTRLVNQQIKLLKWAKEQSIPVLVLEYTSFGETDEKLMKHVRNNTHKVITKNYDGGFYGLSEKEVKKTLKTWKVDSIIIAGINGCCCIFETAMGAVEYGINVMTSSDIVGNINQNPPLYPNDTWYFNHARFQVFPRLSDIIN